MKRFIKTILGLMALIAIGIGLSAYWAAQATQKVPDFYSAAIEAPGHDLEQTKQQLQEKVEQLTREVQRVGGWEATFTSDQINAWLATDLTDEYPDLLPTGTQEPRVLIEDGKVVVAAKYANGQLDSVISFELEARLTDQPNVIALKVSRLRAGALPIPIRQFSDRITKAASRGDFEIRWEEEDGIPIALIRVPTDHRRYIHKPVIIEKLQLRSGEAYLAGQTGPEAETAWFPAGPIYQLAGSGPRVIHQH